MFSLNVLKIHQSVRPRTLHPRTDLSHPSGADRMAVSSVLMGAVIVLLIAVVVAGYLVLSPKLGGQANSQSSSKASQTLQSTTTMGMASFLATSTPTSSSTVNGMVNYRGNFTYVTPLGPSGINDSSGKPVQWNSTQTASGTFTFSINPATSIGRGSGQGTITVATHGYCTGSTTVQYSFTINAVYETGFGFEIGFNNPNPPTVMVQMSCQGSTNGFFTANNSVKYLSVYPNGLNPVTIPYTTSQSPKGGIGFTVNIQQGS